MNVHGKTSQDVQACILEFTQALGFQSEKNGLFLKYKTKNIRPDFYFPFGRKRGILLEVERGKTTVNNMDLSDIWKCHLCNEAQYLFLLVPKVRPNEKGKVTRVFSRVVNRLEPFFQTGNYINVNGVFIFGY